MFQVPKSFPLRNGCKPNYALQSNRSNISSFNL
jgi:hypothetical protein